MPKQKEKKKGPTVVQNNKGFRREVKKTRGIREKEREEFTLTGFVRTKPKRKQNKPKFNKTKQKCCLFGVVFGYSHKYFFVLFLYLFLAL